MDLCYRKSGYTIIKTPGYYLAFLYLLQFDSTLTINTVYSLKSLRTEGIAFSFWIIKVIKCAQIVIASSC